MVHTNGIPAKNLGDDLYVRVYVKQADGSYKYGKIISYNPKTYAYNRLAKSNDPQMKAVCVALLNYGAAAQVYFDYKANELVNANLTADQKALVADYSADLFSGDNKIIFADEKIENFQKSANRFASLSATVSFEGAFAINYYFTPSETIVGDMTFYYWTADAFKSNTTLATNNASGTITMKSTGDGRYWAQISGIAAKSIDDVFYVAATYTDGNDTYCTGVIPYSVSKYCVSKATGEDAEGNPTNLASLAQATAMYGYYAKQYFVKES